MGLLGGVSATQIDATTMQISARGNGFTDIGQIRNYVMLKAADETVQHGFDLFQIVNTEDASRTDHFSIPVNHTHSVMSTGIGPDGPVTTFGTVNYTTERNESVDKPGEDIVIRMFSGAKPADAPANVFAAREVIRYLGSEIRPQSDSAALSPTITPDVLPATNAAPVTAEETSVPAPATCTKEDKELAQMARANGYQYHSGCNF